jgi:maltodextrin utilization protein YvdJ
MGFKEIVIIVLTIAAIPALFMLAVGLIGGSGKDSRK